MQRTPQTVAKCPPAPAKAKAPAKKKRKAAKAPTPAQVKKFLGALGLSLTITATK